MARAGKIILSAWLVFTAGLVAAVWYARATDPVERRDCVRGHWQRGTGKSKAYGFVCDHWRVTLKVSR